MRWPKYYRGWLVWNPGGGGGGGTVQTDGVTIQGDGSAGNKIAIKQVETAVRLTGAGTVASPLDIAGWPLKYWIPFPPTNTDSGTGANQLFLVAFIIPAPVQFSRLGFNVQTADGASNSDVGLYNAAGTLIANIGAQLLASTGNILLSTVQGSIVIAPGVYFAAATNVSGTLTLASNNSGQVLYGSTNFGSSSGGALPASITPPTLVQQAKYFAFQLYL